MAKQFGWDVYGIELNGKAVSVAESYGLRVRKKPAETTGYKTGFFDIVRITNHQGLIGLMTKEDRIRRYPMFKKHFYYLLVSVY